MRPKAPGGAGIRPALLAAAVLAGACVRTPPVRYYTLADAGDAGVLGAEPADRPARWRVRVAAASVPEALDRPEMVLRVSATELAIDDGHRWAEPLPSALGRAVAADLARALAGASVVFADDVGAEDASADVEVILGLRHLDLALGREATVDAIWILRFADGRARTGRSIARAPAAGGHDALAGAIATALLSVSADVARALRP